MFNKNLKFTGLVTAGMVMGTLAMAAPAGAAQSINAPVAANAFTLDGKTDDWKGIKGTTVALKGDGGVSSVMIKFAVHGDMIYVLAEWADSTQDVLHKPYKWDAGSQSYKKTKDMEDRFAITLKMSGNFSASKIDGSVFTADVWHWKASRSNPMGLAHDKHWIVSDKPVKKAKKFTTPDGKTVYVRRKSDKGSRLYKPTRYDVKQKDVMPRYKLNMSPTGSIADVKAKGVWRDGRWYLEMARKLNTGNADDAVISAKGSIEIAIAAFNAVDGRKHSTSEKLILNTGMPGS